MFSRLLKSNPSRQNVILAIVTLWILFLGGVKLLYEIDRQPYFIDEASDTLAALNFIRTGDYHSPFFDQAQRFGPTLSVGLAASWPGGLTWAMGGSLFESRWALAVVAFFELVILLILFFCRVRSPLGWSVMLSCLVWLLTFQTPYWYGHFLNLGELTAALGVAWGAFFFPKRRFLAFAILGVATWSGKFMVAPIAFAMGIAALTLASSNERIRLGIRVAGFYFLPLGLWLSLMVLRYDFATMLQWMERFLDFIVKGQSGLDRLPMTIWQRLQTPTLEWSSFGAGTQIRVLGLMFGPIGLFFLLRKQLWKDRVERSLLVAMLSALTFLATWYFFWSPTMYIRHAQPAMYLGFGLFVYMATRWGSGQPRRMIRIAQGFLLLIMIKESWTMTTRFPVLLPKAESYPRNCQKDLTRQPCVPPDIEQQILEVEAQKG